MESQIPFSVLWNLQRAEVATLINEQLGAALTTGAVKKAVDAAFRGKVAAAIGLEPWPRLTATVTATRADVLGC